MAPVNKKQTAAKSPSAEALPPAEFNPAVPLDLIDRWDKQPRKRFDEETLQEFAAEVRRDGGVQQPIRLRPNPSKKGRFLIVFGERRYRASRMAELKTIMALVGDMSEKQAYELAMRENLQREQLQPIEESDGYEYMRRTFGYTAQEIAARVDKSQAHVYQYLALQNLAPSVRRMLEGGEIIGVCVAMELARITNHPQQERAAAELSKQHTATTADARALIRSRYVLPIVSARFDTASTTLCKEAGACGTCPKNSASQREFFPDEGKEAYCLDETCWSKKTDLHWHQLRAKAQEKGQRVIEGAEADRLTLIGSLRHDAPMIDLTQAVYIDEGTEAKPLRTAIKAYLDEHPEVIIHVRTKEGVILEAIDRKIADKAKRACGVYKPREQAPAAPERGDRGSSEPTKPVKASRQEEPAEDPTAVWAEVKARMIAAIMRELRHGKPLERSLYWSVLRPILYTIFTRMEAAEAILARNNLKGELPEDTAQIADLKAHSIVMMIAEAGLAEHYQPLYESVIDPKLRELAAPLGIDLDAIRAEVLEEQRKQKAGKK